MSLFLQCVAIGVCLLMLMGLAMEMQKRRLSENQAILWIVGVLGLLILSIFPHFLEWVAGVLGIWWPPATLLFFLIIIMIVIILRHTVTLSATEAQIKELAMQVALLKSEVRDHGLQEDLNKGDKKAV